MKKTVFIHIGGPKTGTTALQDFFSRNRQVLRNRGFFYPGEGQAHREICDELAAHTTDELRTLPKTCVCRWIQEMERSSCHTHVISAECFSYVAGGEKLRALISPEFQAVVVYYARRQDNLIESWYNEVVKSQDVRMKKPLDAELVNHCYGMREFDHLRVITPWAEAFGQENVIVRCHEKTQMPGGIIEDFTRLIGLSVDSAFWIPPDNVNKSLDTTHTEFLRLCNRHLPDDPGINRFLYWYFFRNSRIQRAPVRKHLLSPEQRIEILNHYQESNQRFAKVYTGRQDGRLFFEPWPDPDEPWEPYRGLTAEELVPILAELIAGQAVRERTDQPLQTILGIANTALRKINGAPSQGCCPAVPDQYREDLLKSRTAEELVPLVVKILYERDRQMQERRQPLATALRILNRPLARAVSLLPVRKRNRLSRRLAGGGGDNG